MFCKFLFAACLLGSAAQAADRTLVYPAIPGTTVPNRSATPLVIENDVIYPAIRGTQTPSRTGPSWSVRDGQVRQNIPGTQVPRER